MPGLIGAVARTAVVAGTATGVSNRDRRMSRQQPAAGVHASTARAVPATHYQPPPPVYQQAPVYQPPAQYEQPPVYGQLAAPPQTVPAAEPGPHDMSAKLAELQQLGELKTQGILTEEEFQAQKNEILAG
ncbi:MAG: SHOCT domain-containing protein [Chloroflexi bacterium]|nr:SHOCT domain-containing protein [Chloroflexota bacterium]